MPLTDAEVKTRLETLCQSATEPTLSSPELDTLVKQAKRADSEGRRFYPAWQATRAYAVGDLVVPTTRNAHVYECTAAGTSGASQPSFPTTQNATVADGTVNWQEVGDDDWVPTYDLNAAAAEGWRLKAGKVVPLYTASAGASRFERAQIYAHCIQQANVYVNKTAQTIATPAVAELEGEEEEV